MKDWTSEEMVLWVPAASSCATSQFSKSEIFKRKKRQLSSELVKKNPTRKKLDFEMKEKGLSALGRVYAFIIGIWTKVIKTTGKANIDL